MLIKRKAAEPPPKYKICRTCGNRNHPLSGQCAWCGGRLRRPVDWFSSLGIVAIILTVLALVAYTMSERPPSTSKMRLPRLGGAAATSTN